MTRPKVIDAWIQPWTKEVVEGLPDRALHVFKQYGQASRLQDGISLEVMMEEMDAAQVDISLISGGPMVPMPLVLEAMERWPDRLRAVVWTDPTQTSIVRALADLEALVRNYPVCGFKMEAFALWRDPTDRVFYPLYAKCAELGIALQTQVGGTGPLYPSRTGQPLLIDEIALDFPELKIVCGHVGSPWVDEMIHVAWKHPNVFIDTSARLPKYFEPAFTKFLTSFGQDKCIYASDWPVLDFQRPLAQVDSLGLTPEVREKFLVSNAIAAFGLDDLRA